MSHLDPAAEYRQLREVYEQMADEELAALADEAYELTDTARQTLAGEISRRRLEIRLRSSPSDPAEARRGSGFAAEVGSPRDFDPSDLELTVLRRTWDLQEARTAKEILDEARIPSYLGDDNLECAADVRTFEGGVDLKVRAEDALQAMHTLAVYWPDSPDSADQRRDEECAEYVVRCPRCGSADIVFLERDGALTGNSAFNAKFRWTCDPCGHVWEDDGIEQKA
jgi:hypothetical protein